METLEMVQQTPNTEIVQLDNSKNVYVNASILPLSSVCDYKGKVGYENVVISNGKIVNVVSKNYGFLNNNDFFPIIEQDLQQSGVNYTATYKNVDDRYFIADYILTDAKFALPMPEHQRRRDTITPKLRFINSYDGSCKTSGNCSFFREICTNGLHGMVQDIAFSLKHRASIQEAANFNIPQTIKNYIESDAIVITKTFKDLQNIKVHNLQDAIKLVCFETGIFKYEMSDKNLNPSINASYVTDVVAKECETFDIVPNAWIVYNAFNQWLYDDERNKKHETVRMHYDNRLVLASNQLYN